MDIRKLKPVKQRQNETIADHFHGFLLHNKMATARREDFREYLEKPVEITGLSFESEQDRSKAMEIVKKFLELHKEHEGVPARLTGKQSGRRNPVVVVFSTLRPQDIDTGEP